LAEKDLGAVKSVTRVLVGVALLALGACGSGESSTGSQAGVASKADESTPSTDANAAEPESKTGSGVTEVGSRVTRGCLSRVEGEPTPTKEDVDVGPVTFYNLRAASRQPATFYERRDGGYPTYKTVISVKASTTVTIVADDPRRLGLNYDKSGDFVAELVDVPSAVTFEACPPSEPRFSGDGSVGATTEFNGGFVSAGPGCRSFRVILGQGGDPIAARLGFGTEESQC
jgi:hypothetical protein